MSALEPIELRIAIDAAVETCEKTRAYSIDWIIEHLEKKKVVSSEEPARYIRRAGLRSILRNHRRMTSIPPQTEADLFGVLPRVRRIAVEYVDQSGRLQRDYRSREELTIDDLDRLILRRERLVQESKSLRELRSMRDRVARFRSVTANLGEALRLADAAGKSR